MHPIKLKLGAMPAPVQTQITPVPGAPQPLQNTASARPTAVGAQATVKSPKPKKPGDMSKSDAPSNGISKLKMFMDNRASKKNQVSQK